MNQTPRPLNRYTAWIAWHREAGIPPYVEEIDVDAADATTADAQVRRLLLRDYEPGGQILAIKERPATAWTGFYL